MKHIQSTVDGTHHRQPEHLHFQSTCSAHGRLEQSAKSIRFMTSMVDKHISVKELLGTSYRQNIVQICVNPCGRKLRKWKMKVYPFQGHQGRHGRQQHDQWWNHSQREGSAKKTEECEDRSPLKITYYRSLPRIRTCSELWDSLITANFNASDGLQS